MTVRCQICSDRINPGQLVCHRCWHLAPFELRHEWENARPLGWAHMEVVGRKIIDALLAKRDAALPKQIPASTANNPQPDLL